MARKKLISPGSLIIDIHQQTTLHAKITIKENVIDTFADSFITFNAEEPMIVVASVKCDDSIAERLYMLVTTYGVGWDWDPGSWQIIQEPPT
jgi:hypothetical protein